MAKRKKDKVVVSKKVVKKSLTTRSAMPKKKSKAKKKLAFWQKKDGTPKWLNKDGTVGKKYKKFTKYLTKSGKLRKNAKLPFKVKKLSTLFTKIYNPTYPEWFNKNGEVKKVMLKYLTKKGELRKNVKLPQGVKTIKQLWEWVQSNSIKKNDDKRLKCETFYEFYWIFEERVNDTFDKYKKVFMGGKQITYSEWELYGKDYIQSVINLPNDYEIEFTICYFKKYKYLFF